VIRKEARLSRGSFLHKGEVLAYVVSIQNQNLKVLKGEVLAYVGRNQALKHSKT